MKVAILASGLAGYLDASLRALVESHDVDLLLVAPQASENVDFEPLPITRQVRFHPWAEEPDGRDLITLVEDFNPDALIVHSWHLAPYRAVLKSQAGRSVRLLWMDNNWRRTPKQWLGVVTSPWFVQRLFDVAFVACDRTEEFARRLGFASADILRGSFSADTALYGAAPASGEELRRRARFLSVLRMVHHKGPDILADAYQQYRDRVTDPWELHVVGLGPMLETLAGQPGVVSHGFVQPRDLAPIMRGSSAYINPSRVESYGVVLHEAAAASLPILTSDAVGASPYFVQDGYNGWNFPTGDAAALARRMADVSEASDVRLADMSRLSHAYSQRLSPQGWARNLVELVTDRNQRGRTA